MLTVHIFSNSSNNIFQKVTKDITYKVDPKLIIYKEFFWKEIKKMHYYIRKSK